MCLNVKNNDVVHNELIIHTPPAKYRIRFSTILPYQWAISFPWTFVMDLKVYTTLSMQDDIKFLQCIAEGI